MLEMVFAALEKIDSDVDKNLSQKLRPPHSTSFPEKKEERAEAHLVRLGLDHNSGDLES